MPWISDAESLLRAVGKDSSIQRDNLVNTDFFGAPSSCKMKTKKKIKDGAQCKVIGGVHAGKAGTVRDIKTGKTGFVSITVVQSNGERFKTLAKNVEVQP